MTKSLGIKKKKKYMYIYIHTLPEICLPLMEVCSGVGGVGICVHVLLMLDGLGDADFNLNEGEAGEARVIYLGFRCEINFPLRLKSINVKIIFRFLCKYSSSSVTIFFLFSLYLWFELAIQWTYG